MASSRRTQISVAVIALACAVFAVDYVSAQKVASPPAGPPERTADIEIVGHIVKPPELPLPDVSKLRVPEGFRIERFATDLGNARVLAVSPAGNVYVTRREQADVLMLKVGSDGLASGEPVRVAARPNLHGIAFYKNSVYLVTVRELFRADVLEDGRFGPLELLLADLPDGGQHHNRTLAFGPDGMMYISAGSTCNECAEPNPENATMLRLSADAKQRAIFASGLRNTVGFGWHPVTGEMWGMDHGIDWLGDDNQPEELNEIVEGKNYGWPYFYASNAANPHMDPPGGLEKSDFAKVSVPMAMAYVAHSAPMQMSFYSGSQFPAEFQGDAFVSMRGSWNRRPPSGYEVVRVRFKDGRPVGFQPFVTGFLTPAGQHGRLCGNAVAKDGSLLFTDDRNGAIYRVSYVGDQKPGAPIAAKPETPPHPVRGPIAIEAPETKTTGKLTVTSPAFANDAPIPPTYSAYEQNASPPLKWSAGPEGTKSYAILMDDPDGAALQVPVSHWVAWNVPVTELPEGVQPAHRSQFPKGMWQGVNYSGKVGYAGPRPPAGDAPHHYHIQVFALDALPELSIGSKRADLLAAMKGHVLAAGEVVGTFARPPEPKKP